MPRLEASRRRTRCRPSVPTPLSARKAALEQRLVELGARTEAIEEELGAHRGRKLGRTCHQNARATRCLKPPGAGGADPWIARRPGSKDGGYGECVRCGTRIAEARLDLLPWTPLAGVAHHDDRPFPEIADPRRGRACRGRDRTSAAGAGAASGRNARPGGADAEVRTAACRRTPRWRRASTTCRSKPVPGPRGLYCVRGCFCRSPDQGGAGNVRRRA